MGVTGYGQCPLRIPLRKIIREGQLEPKDDPEPSISPLPPCDVSQRDLDDFRAAAGMCGRKLDAECPCAEYREWIEENPPIRTRRAARARRPKREREPEAESAAAKPKAPTWGKLDDEEKESIRRRVRLYIEGQPEASASDIHAALPDIDKRHVTGALKDLVSKGVIEKRGKGRGTTYSRVSQRRLLDD